MLVHRAFCASCRLRACIAAKRIARSRGGGTTDGALSLLSAPTSFPSSRFSLGSIPPISQAFHSSRRLRSDGHSNVVAKTEEELEISEHVDETETESPEEQAHRARRTYGDALPERELGEEAYRIYERLFGKPVRFDADVDLDAQGGGVVIEVDGDERSGTGVLKEMPDGGLEEVEFEVEEEEARDVDEGEVVVDFPEGRTPTDADARLARDIEMSMASAATSHDEVLDPEDLEFDDEDGTSFRAHPLTLAGRFATSPSTIYLPKNTFVDLVQAQLATVSNAHLSQAAHRVFGGVGLPYSTSTPALAKALQQKPIPLEAGQSSMAELEGDVFLGVLWPGMYASVMSILVETRKRMGTAWAEDLVKKAEQGILKILDAGSGGAGILAVRDMLKAEWERMHEENEQAKPSMALAHASGTTGGASLAPPLGHATVLTGSGVLRKRASELLENTTFIPRLPDYVHTEDQSRKGKFDIIIAPHTLWGLKEDHLRKTHVQNLWSLLSHDGGVLLLLEKGVARGFELIAGARQMLLDSHIASDQPNTDETPLHGIPKETGMIIGPCTNHTRCPMYSPPGMVRGRRDICHFSQRYIRPPFLQNILGAKDKNFEDVRFSYLSIMRGRDLRKEQDAFGEQAVRQDQEATDRSFLGYEDVDLSQQQQEQRRNLTLALPRAVLPPLKRHGHVILDLCTPSGTLERWTVPKSFSRQAFRDARKSSWGDLWALGAKTRVPRVPKIKKRKTDADMDVKLKKGDAVEDGPRTAVDYDEYGRLVVKETMNDVGGKRSQKRGGKGKSRKKKLKA